MRVNHINSTLNTSRIEIDKKMYSNLEISQASPIVTPPPKHSNNSIEVSTIRPKYTLNSKSFQPSLDAGGVVDLSKTFSLTKYGTYSFGGERKSCEASRSIDTPARTQSTKQYSNKDLFGNPSLNVFRQDSIKPNQKPSLSKEISPEEVSQLSTPLELRLTVADTGEILVSRPLTENVEISQNPTQMIYAVPVSRSSNLSEVVIPRLHRRMHGSLIRHTISSLGFQRRSRRDTQSLKPQTENVPNSIPSLLVVRIEELGT